MSTPITAKPPQTSHSNPLATTLKVTAKVGYATACCATGLGLIAISIAGVYNAVQRLNHFYFFDPSDSENVNTPESDANVSAFKKIFREDWISDDPKGYNGLGLRFENACSWASDKMSLDSAKTFCEKLAKQPWREIRSLDTMTVALAVPITTGLGICYAALTGLTFGSSLVLKSFSIILTIPEDILYSNHT